jgi:competence ComEA-like helix-hairpin-helix protein
MQTHLARIVERFKASSFAPLALKGLGALCAIVALGFVGSGFCDRWMHSAKASSATAQKAAPTSADSEAPAAIATEAASAATTNEPAASLPTSSATASPDCHVVDGKVVLNLATVDELESLGGIGASKAEKIVELRRKLGKFTHLEDLYRIKGIKRKLLDKLRPKLLLDPPPDCTASSGSPASPVKAP